MTRPWHYCVADKPSKTAVARELSDTLAYNVATTQGSAGGVQAGKKILLRNTKAVQIWETAQPFGCADKSEGASGIVTRVPVSGEQFQCSQGWGKFRTVIQWLFQERAAAGCKKTTL